MSAVAGRIARFSSSYSLAGVGARTGSLGGTKACVVTADFGSRR